MTVVLSAEFSLTWLLSEYNALEYLLGCLNIYQLSILHSQFLNPGYES